jgi:acyl carrier protein
VRDDSATISMDRRTTACFSICWSASIRKSFRPAGRQHREIAGQSCALHPAFWEGEKLLDLQTVENEVAKIFSQKLHVDVPSRHSDLFEAGILDSLHLVELILELEQQFCVRISVGETDLENFCTIERISLVLAREYDGGSQD